MAAYTDHWKVANGVITCSPGGNGPATDKEYDNFEIELKFRVARGGNSGVLLRSPLDGHPSVDGMEIQILDDAAAEILRSSSPISIAAVCTASSRPSADHQAGGRVAIDERRATARTSA